MISTSSHPALRLCSPACRRLGGPPRSCPKLRRVAAMSITNSAELEQATVKLVQELEARVAELHLQAQALNKQSGREAEATAVYKELAALDDEALELTLSGGQPPTAADIAAVASAFPALYTPLLPLPHWDSAERRRRALGAVLGAAMGDAAACSCQWVYSEPAMVTLAVAAAERGVGLEFFDPPQCPFFSYPLGSPSPYFEQAAVLLRSLVKAGRLDLASYAAAIFAAFGPGYAGYRDRSTKNFLRRYAAGAAPPLTGTADDQANAFARLPPLVALYAGTERGELVAAVNCMVRVTQNDPVAVAFGTAAALILEAVVQGASAAAAVASTIDWLLQQAAEQQQQAGQQVDGAAVEPVPGSLWAEVATRLLQAAELAPLPPLEAAAQLGRNCHLPNSLQTPLQVVLHLELCHAQQAQQQQQQQEGQAPQGIGQHLEERPGDQQGGQAGAVTAEQQGNAPAQNTSAEGGDADFCLPCSMGACPLPGTPAERSAAAGRRVLAAIQQQQRAGTASQLPPESFVEGVRLAIRPGGCCASRAGFVGALLGALGVQLPADWEGRVLGYGEVREQAERLARLRD